MATENEWKRKMKFHILTDGWWTDRQTDRQTDRSDRHTHTEAVDCHMGREAYYLGQVVVVDRVSCLLENGIK